jgi:hypothetical protein
MIKINIDQTTKTTELMEPEEMLNTPHGTVFQLMDSDEPCDTYFISCGFHEKRVVVLWYENEECCWKLSTDNKKGLRKYIPHIKVREVNATVTIDLEVV